MLTADTKRRLPALIKGNSLRITPATIGRIAHMAESKLHEHGVRRLSRPTCKLFVFVPRSDRHDAHIVLLVRKGKAWQHADDWQAPPGYPYGKGRVRWWLSLCEVARNDVLFAVEASRYA